MENPFHSMESLFDQLGLESSEQSINAFIASNSPLASEVPLDGAAFWNAAQADLLRQMKDEDADWAEVVDQLDARLR